jgi:hypothetical protein
MQSQETSVSCRLYCHSQNLMGVVIERHKAKGLEYASLSFSDRVQHFSHAVHAAGLGLKRHFHEVTFGEPLGKLQQSTIDRNDLNIALGSLAVTELYDYRCGCEFDAISAMGWVRLGIVCHAGTTMALAGKRGEITEAQCTNSWAFRALTCDFCSFFGGFRQYPTERLR